MNKHEFKRAWRAFRIEIRQRQHMLDHTSWSASYGFTRDLDARGTYLCCGYTKTVRSAEAHRMQNSGKGIGALVNPWGDLNARRERVRISRMFGPISFGRAA